MASLIIKANLECEKCCKKIQKVLNKLKGMYGSMHLLNYVNLIP